uniref:Folate/biopterin transporter n=1 Tax=Aureoumbra lagunensis TaxID=44058 RepID=A0A7S3K602_9STRA|mmetsp:Transcript_7727/g.10760  ORF Transcript_7727/g.10760 Transcript_7727/m.10760 type:complete len:547 (+) Transcript_7727:41-1681(+)
MILLCFVFLQVSRTNSFAFSRNSRVLRLKDLSRIEVHLQRFVVLEAKESAIEDEEILLINQEEKEETKSDLNMEKDLVIVVFLVYFLQGALSLARLATNYYLKDDLQVSAAEVAALQGLFVAPWTVKPIFGFLSDTIPLWGYRRKSYLAISGVVGCLSFVAMSMWSSSQTIFVFTNIVSAAAVAFADVVADSVVVERSRNDDTAAFLQSVSWGSRYVGSIGASLLSGAALRNFGAKGCWLATAPLPLLVAVAAFAIREEPLSSVETKKTENASSLRAEAQGQLSKLWSALTSDQVLRPAVFIFLWQATPTCASAFFYFSTGATADGGLGFDPEFVGRASALGNVAGFLGIASYNAFFSKTRLSTIIGTTSALSAIVGCLPLVLIYHWNRDYLGLPDKFFAIGDGVVQSALGEVGFIPVLVLASKVCPPGIEGSLFAALMSIFNLGGIVSQELGALLTSFFGVTSNDFTNLAPLITLCSLSSLLPILVLDWVKRAEIVGTGDDDDSAVKAVAHNLSTENDHNDIIPKQESLAPSINGTSTRRRNKVE